MEETLTLNENDLLPTESNNDIVENLNMTNRNITGIGATLKFPEFDDIPVSTKTFIVMTNLLINLEKTFEFLPITDYTVVPKRRGRKRKTETNDPNKDLPEGSIITIKFENQIKGVDLKQRKSHSIKKKKWFRNSITVIIILDNKPINFKICKNGMFQITGCKFDRHAELCIKHIWYFINEQENNLFTFTKNQNKLECIFLPVMRNIDFDLGFNIDREKLSKYISTHTRYHSLLETSFGYTGCNVKVKLKHDFTLMKIKKITYEDIDDIRENIITYGDYLATLPEKDRLKKLNKERFNTFLIFHSGSILYSGSTAEFMRDIYYEFIEIIKEGYDHIVERLE